MQRKRELIQRTREVNVAATGDTGERVDDETSTAEVHSTKSTSVARALLDADEEILPDHNIAEQV